MSFIPTMALHKNTITMMVLPLQTETQISKGRNFSTDLQRMLTCLRIHCDSQNHNEKVSQGLALWPCLTVGTNFTSPLLSNVV